MGLTDQKAKPLRERDMNTKRHMVVQYMKRTGLAAVSFINIGSWKGTVEIALGGSCYSKRYF